MQWNFMKICQNEMHSQQANVQDGVKSIKWTQKYQ